MKMETTKKAYFKTQVQAPVERENEITKFFLAPKTNCK